MCIRDRSLIDHLRGTHAVQFGRSVSRQNEQRHEGEIRLGHAGVQLRRRGATGDNDGDRPLAHQGPTQRKKPGASFVESHVQRELTSRRGR